MTPGRTPVLLLEINLFDCDLLFVIRFWFLNIFLSLAVQTSLLKDQVLDFVNDFGTVRSYLSLSINHLVCLVLLALRSFTLLVHHLQHGRIHESQNQVIAYS